MTIAFTDTYLPAASINQAYGQYITVTGGIAPYSFALIAGSMPPGLTLTNSGLISGTPTTLGLYSITIEASDSTSTPQTATHTYSFEVLDIISLLDSTVDQAQFVQAFENDLSTSNTWSPGITSSSSQTQIEYISAIGTFLTSRISRAVEDVFPSTAQSDSAIRATVNMQGLRLNRKLPATVPATLVSTIDQTLPAFTQLSGGGYNWFLKSAVQLHANVPITVTLREGLVTTVSLGGLGTDFQTWVSEEDGFTVSDQDVTVSINGADINKSFGALWNFANQGAFVDNTLPDGRLQIQFGSQGYGSIPGVNDAIVITYAVTQGQTINGAALNNTTLTGSSVSNVTGTFTSNADGGANEKSTVAYKNFAAGSFGTFSSAVTKAQYSAVVSGYPGIIDAVTQAQREINPAALKWMNVIRVSALTSGTWSQDQINEFTSYVQSVSMFSPDIIWQTPTAIPRDVVVTVYCYNSVNSLSDVKANATTAIQNMFAPRPGLLMTDFVPDDLAQTCRRAAPGQVAYVVVNEPTSPMIVTAPKSPTLTYQVLTNGGSLTAQQYAYAVAVDTPAPNPYFMGLIDAAANPSTFPTATVVGQYWLISSTGSIGGYGANAGDQLLAINTGNVRADFNFVLYGAHTAIDQGSPTNWVQPQVLVSGGQVLLDWSSNPVEGAIFYHVWGRRPGAIGILANLAGSVVTYTDPGGADPTPVDPGIKSDFPIRYNSLRNLTVNVMYAPRQNDALLPVRDTTL